MGGAKVRDRKLLRLGHLITMIDNNISSGEEEVRSEGIGKLKVEFRMGNVLFAAAALAFIYFAYLNTKCKQPTLQIKMSDSSH